MKYIALIPARLESTRFPNKLVQSLGSSTVIGTTYSNVVNMQLFDEVYVVTDSDTIAGFVQEAGGKVLRNKRQHETGTDRIAEFAWMFGEKDIIVNVQGDEPFLKKEMLEDVLRLFSINSDDCMVSSLKHPLDNEEEISNPNNVKVVCREDGSALLFSRSPIPYYREETMARTYYRHIGVYAFTQKALKRFSELPVSDLERAEKLENLRFLENSIPVYLAVTPHTTIGIDTEADWLNAQKLLQ